jgi:beta-amylase
MLWIVTFLLSYVCEMYVMYGPKFDKDQHIVDPAKFEETLRKYKSIGVDGVSFGLIWALCEPLVEKQYVWTGYHETFAILKKVGIKGMPQLCFAGGCVPAWVGGKKPWMKGPDGYLDPEMISYAWDDLKVTDRTPIEIYRDFMTAFAKEFKEFVASDIMTNVEILTGPFGELRYPSFQSGRGWKFPGCGTFQSYDDEMTKLLKAAATEAGHPDWGHCPTNTGTNPNVRPGYVEFWTNNKNGYSGEYGQFFINWYSKLLLKHGREMMKAAREAFGPKQLMHIKLAGCHWWYENPTHCIETTAGINDFSFHDGYKDIAKACKEYEFGLGYTALEQGTNGHIGMNNPKLVQQVVNATTEAGIYFMAENAGECYDKPAYDRMRVWPKRGLKILDFLHSDSIFEPAHWAAFTQLVADMHEGRTREDSE